MNKFKFWETSNRLRIKLADYAIKQAARCSHDEVITDRTIKAVQRWCRLAWCIRMNSNSFSWWMMNLTGWNFFKRIAYKYYPND